MQIAALQKLTLLDYPGKIAATIFTPGCNFRCGFCHNPELVTQIDPQNFLDLSEVLNFFKKRKKYLEAVCFTGGEPLLQTDITEFIKKLKKIGYLIKIDTNGTNPDLLKDLIKNKLIDYIALDIKTVLDWEKYKKAIGVNNKELLEKVIETKDILLKLNSRKEIDYEFRTTVVPNVVNLEDLEKIAQEIKGAKRYILQQFRNTRKMIDESFKEVKPYSLEELKNICQKIRKFVNYCEVRG